jgi:hypothetical protein
LKTNKKGQVNLDANKSNLGYWLSFLRSQLPSNRQEAAQIPTLVMLTHQDQLDGQVPPNSIDLANHFTATFTPPFVFQSPSFEWSKVIYVGGDAQTYQILKQEVVHRAQFLASQIELPRAYIEAQSALEKKMREMREQGQLPALSVKQVHDLIVASDEMFVDDNGEMLERAMEYLIGTGDLLVDENADLVVLFPLEWFFVVLSCFIGDVGGGQRITEDGRGRYDLKTLKSSPHLLEFCQAEDVPKLMHFLERLEFCVRGDEHHHQQHRPRRTRRWRGRCGRSPTWWPAARAH